MAISKGYASVVGWRKNPNTWGCGAPVLVGAGHGIEILPGESLVSNTEFIENDGISGNATQLPGTKGRELHAGDLPMNLYFQGVERMIAQVMGLAGAPTLLGAGVHKHVFRIAEDSELLAGTLVIDGQVAVREYPFTKLSMFEMTWESGGKGQISFHAVPFAVNYNEGVADNDAAHASTDVANGSYVISTQQTNPYGSPVRVQITDANASITEHVITFTGTDPDGNVVTEEYRLSIHGLVFVGLQYFNTLISIVGSATAGTVDAGVDVVIIGYTYGVNSQANAALITITSPNAEQFVLYSQIQVLTNAQNGADFVAGACDVANDEIFPTSLSVMVDRQVAEDDVSSKFGNRVDNPTEDDFIIVEGAMGFTKWTTESHRAVVIPRLVARRQKTKIEFVGPIAGGAFPYRLTLWLNNVQYTEGGSPNISAIGRVPVDVSFKAHRTTLVPTGFPGGYDQALTIELTNLNSVDALTNA